MKTFLDGRVTLHNGDCLDVLKTIADASIDSIVTDPPYHLTSEKKGGTGVASLNPNSPAGRARIGTGFMGKAWDGGDIAFRPELWAEVLRVLKPGGHCAAFSGTRTYHRMACAIEDAGFEIRDQLAWVYGQGFPKSMDVSKAIDRAAEAEREVVGIAGKSGSSRSCMAGDFAGGEYMATAPATDAARQWQGWGTALKPAWEPICLARKPLIGTVAENVLTHGTGGINIAGCRVEGEGEVEREGEASQDRRYTGEGGTNFAMKPGPRGGDPLGRFPANLVHDGSPEVLAGFPQTKSGMMKGGTVRAAQDVPGSVAYGVLGGLAAGSDTFGDEGSAARFFYTAKADADDRVGSNHPTVKPVDLMQWLCRLITPPRGVVLDLFAGTGTTGEAAYREGFSAVLIEREVEYAEDIARRMALVVDGKGQRRVKIAAAKAKRGEPDHGPLWKGLL